MSIYRFFPYPLFLFALYSLVLYCTASLISPVLFLSWWDLSISWFQTLSHNLLLTSHSYLVLTFSTQFPLDAELIQQLLFIFMCSTVQKLPKEGNIWANNEKYILTTLQLCICDTLPPFFFDRGRNFSRVGQETEFQFYGKFQHLGEKKSEGTEVLTDWKFRENIFVMMEVFHNCQIILTPESPKVIMTLKYSI